MRFVISCLHFYLNSKFYLTEKKLEPRIVQILLCGSPCVAVQIVESSLSYIDWSAAAF